MKMRPGPSCAEVLAQISYEPKTGVFRRLTAIRGKPIGSDATIKSNSYRMIYLRSIGVFHAHRLAWLIMTGDWPRLHLDHINGIPTDNRWINLRLATIAQNAQNKRACNHSKSGIKGVCFDPKRRKWAVYISANGKPTTVGRYNTLEMATVAYATAARQHFGEFARHG
jgi:hypothetical protein